MPSIAGSSAPSSGGTRGSLSSPGYTARSSGTSRTVPGGSRCCRPMTRPPAAGSRWPAPDMEILLLGGTGQLGTELRALPPGGEVRITAPTRQELDLASDEAIAAWIGSRRWSVVVNAAAYTGVDAAQTDAPAAFRVNAAAPARFA